MFKSLKLNLTKSNVALGVAIAALLAVHVWKPELMHDAETFVALALAALGVQVDPLLIKVEQVLSDTSEMH